MSYLRIPRQGIIKPRPRTLPKIDWSNPITKGMVGCWIFNEMGGEVVYNLADRRYDGVWENSSGSLAWGLGDTGVGLQRAAATDDDTVDLGTITTADPISLAHHDRIKFTYVHGCNFTYQAFNTFILKGGSGATGGWGVWISTAGATQVKVGIDGVGQTQASALVAGEYHSYGWLRRGTGTAELEQWRDGALISTNTFATLIGTTSQGMGITNTGSAISGNWPMAGFNDYSFLWDRDLTPDEMRSIQENPWQIIKSQVPEIYFIPPAPVPVPLWIPKRGLIKPRPRTLPKLDRSNPLARHLVEGWIFNETSGDVVHALVGPDTHNLTRSGTDAVWDVETQGYGIDNTGAFDNASGWDINGGASISSADPLHMSGSNTYSIAFGSNYRDGRFGRLFDANLVSADSWGALVLDAGPNDTSFGMWLNGSELFRSDDFMITNEYHHYALTRNGGTGTFYRDGLFHEQDTGASSANVGTGTTAIMIANEPGTADAPWNGFIDYLYVFDHELTAAEAKSIADNPWQLISRKEPSPSGDLYFVPPAPATTPLYVPQKYGKQKPHSKQAYKLDRTNPLTKGLVGAWLINEGGGDKFYDLTENSHGTYALTTGTHTGRAISGVFGEALVGEATGSSDGRIDLGSIVSTNPTSLAGRDELTVMFMATHDSGTATNDNPNVITKSDGADGANGWAIRGGENGNRTLHFYSLGFQRAQSPTAFLNNDLPGIYAVTRQSNVFKWYGDGVLLETDVSGFTTDFPTTTTDAAIGNATHTTDAEWSGPIWWVYLWNRTLGPGEVLSITADPYQFVHRPDLYLSTTADAGGGPIEINVGLATEIDSAFAIANKTKDKVVGQSLEVDSAFAIANKTKDKLVGQSIELDSAFTIANKTKSKDVGQSLEVDSAFAIANKTKSKDVGQSLEVDSAFAIGNPVKSHVLDLPTEIDTAFAIANKTKVKTVGQSLETDSAFAIGNPLKSHVLALPVETDTAFAIANKTKDKVVGLSTEIDSAFDVTAVKGFFINVGLATELDSAFVVNKTKDKAVGQATELDIAFSVTSVKLKIVGLATEIDAALVLGNPVKSRDLGLPIETDTAFALGVAAKVKAVGLATETDIAFPVLVSTPDNQGIFRGIIILDATRESPIIDALRESPIISLAEGIIIEVSRNTDISI